MQRRLFILKSTRDTNLLFVFTTLCSECQKCPTSASMRTSSRARHWWNDALYVVNCRAKPILVTESNEPNAINKVSQWCHVVFNDIQCLNWAGTRRNAVPLHFFSIPECRFGTSCPYNCFFLWRGAAEVISPIITFAVFDVLFRRCKL